MNLILRSLHDVSPPPLSTLLFERMVGENLVELEAISEKDAQFENREELSGLAQMRTASRLEDRPTQGIVVPFHKD